MATPAQPPERDFKERFNHQDMAIERGKDSGALTRREVRRLQREQDKVRRLMDDLRREAYSPREAQRRIDWRLDWIDRRIYELSTNSEVAPHFRPNSPPPPPPR
ncbi:hypothetical protein GWK36_03790 [Caldichromatium japonicum]|uniref:Uncharacterized protein n=1 Tax=Caldichromatium japonicum TaxID=2699430 RepID=A0A6G7VBT6_9GAMM|nr:hypothetical protein [Caldichromatium japonicum]QIK37257.1 hypothetical protein GWK36_03790 [Caldichromatium japonicum]